MSIIINYLEVLFNIRRATLPDGPICNKIVQIPISDILEYEYR